MQICKEKQLPAKSKRVITKTARLSGYETLVSHLQPQLHRELIAFWELTFEMAEKLQKTEGRLVELSGAASKGQLLPNKTVEPSEVPRERQTAGRQFPLYSHN